MALQARQEITKALKRAMPTLADESVQAVVNHMLSDKVGVCTIKDLGDIDQSMFPEEVNIPSLKKKQVLAAFATAADSHTRDQNQPQEVDNPAEDLNERVRGLPIIPETRQFSFRVPWDAIDQTTLDKLEEAKGRKKMGNPKLIKDLKLAIMKKLVDSYKRYRRQNPEVTQKHPGRRVYTAIAKEVCEKYMEAVAKVVNNKVLESSESGFRKALETCVENKMKSDPATRSEAVRGQGTVGVIAEEYNPDVLDEDVQEGIRTHLANVYKLDPYQHDWPYIHENMAKTYELQRKHIIKAKEVVEETDDHVDENAEPEIRETEVAKLKKDWPYLFISEGLWEHHRRLTGRDLVARRQQFAIDDHIRNMLMFLTTSTKHNVENLITRLKAEKVRLQFCDGYKFLALCEMLCQVFGEDFNTVIKTVEKTSQPETFEWTVLGEVQYPCIVALDNNKYMAEKYFVCVDKTPLTECSMPDQAITDLFMLCFVLDLEYPAVPKLFEFLERFVFGMGLVETKIFKQNRQIKFVTEAVKKVSEEYELFREQISEALL